MVLVGAGRPGKYSPRTSPYSRMREMSVRNVRRLTTSANVAPCAARIRPIRSMTRRVCARRSSPPTIWWSSSHATWPASISSVRSPSGITATLEKALRGELGTPAGLSRVKAVMGRSYVGQVDTRSELFASISMRG